MILFCIILAVLGSFALGYVAGWKHYGRIIADKVKGQGI
jgi:hypothetical protein